MQFTRSFIGFGWFVVVGAASVLACNPVATPQRDPGPPVADSLFAGLITELSGPGAYFDTDNLISNEASFLKVIPALEARFPSGGGVYIGVGPDQNYSYLAALRPSRAFLIDIRRDNLLQHFLLRAVMEMSSTRVEYLSHLTGRVPPSDPGAWVGRSVEDIVEYVDAAPGHDGLDRLGLEIESEVKSFGLDLSDEDLATIRRFHAEFIRDGLELRFRTHGRAPQWYYPTLRQLILETDINGQQASYLVTADDFQFVRAMIVENRVVPLVGDLAGRAALPKLADWLRERGESVTAIYTSNVEFYLARQGTFGAFARNVAGLPRANDAVIIRSVFPGPFRIDHPHAVEGYYSTQTLQSIDGLVEEFSSGQPQAYQELIVSHLVPLK